MSLLHDQPRRNVVEELTHEIARVSRKAERWREMMESHYFHRTLMKLGLSMMEAEIARAQDAAGAGDLAAMIKAVAALRGYKDMD